MLGILFQAGRWAWENSKIIGLKKWNVVGCFMEGGIAGNGLKGAKRARY